MMLPPAHSGSIGILLYTILYCRLKITSVLPDPTVQAGLMPLLGFAFHFMVGICAVALS